ncbi:hypothetical protein ACHAXS_007054 [Conticribra weissflogii]
MTNQSQARNTSKRHPAFYTVGGIVVGVSASLLIFGVHNANKEKAVSLRGSDQFVEVEPEKLSVPPANHTSTSTLHVKQLANRTNNTAVDSIDVDIGNSTLDTNRTIDDFNQKAIPILDETHIPSPFPTHHPMNPIPTYFPPADSDYPTSMQSYFPTIFDFPTDMPTGIHDSPLENFIQTRSQESAGFRLKLYWEEGYFWQERTEERWWCMQCVDKLGNFVCEKDSRIQLRNCRTKSDLDAIFTYISFGDGGYQFRIANTNNMCLQKMGDRRAIRVKPCKDDQMLQRFVGFDPDLDRFDLRPLDYTDRCLTNHHHPKPNETVYAETCKRAHNYDTGYWVKY